MLARFAGGCAIGLGFLVPAFAQSTDFAGLYVEGHEVRSFSPCGSDDEYWIIDTPASELSRGYAGLRLSPYQPVFVGFSGVFTETPDGAFAADYPAAVAVNELHALKVTIPSGCKTPD